MSDNDIIGVPPRDASNSRKAWGWASYVLQMIVAVAAVIPGAPVTVTLPLVIALIMDFDKKLGAIGTWQESHFDWRLRTGILALVLYAVTWLLFWLHYLPGYGRYIAWVIVSVWFLYRIIKGMARMSANRAIS